MTGGFFRDFIWRLEFSGYAAARFLLRRMSFDQASAFGAWAIRPFAKFFPARDRVARTNMKLAFPEASADEVEAWLAAASDNTGRSFAEFPVMDRMNVYGDTGRVEITGGEHLDAVKASGRGAVIISGHFANWEVTAAAIVQRDLDCAITYRALNNPYMDALVKRQRRAYGVETLTPKAGVRSARGLREALSAGRCVALMNDQKFNQGIAAPLFGHMAMTAPGPARFARSAGVPLIPIIATRLEGARFRVTVYEPIPVAKTANARLDIYDAVLKINVFMEARVREAPGEWFWVHRRWPKKLYGDSKTTGSQASASSGST